VILEGLVRSVFGGMDWDEIDMSLKQKSPSSNVGILFQSLFLPS
jgi:hypothetical protein